MNKAMNIVLYQIIPELDSEHLMFNCFHYVKDLCGDKFPAQIYEAVFNGEVEADNIEDVFAIFNTKYPAGYTGRSMSVSDVLEVIDETGKSQFFFCDVVGYEIVDFDKKKAIKNKF